MRLKHGHGGNFRRLVATATASLGILASVSAVSVTNAPAARAVAIPTVTCSSNPDIFDTGYDAARGGVLPDGSADANWTVAGGYQGLYYPTGTTPPDQVLRPPAGATFLPAQVGNTTVGAWASSPYGISQWVSADYVSSSSPNQQGPSAVDYADWYYKYRFNLGRSVDPSAFVLTMNWLVDNDVAAVFVNGVQQTGTGLPQNTDTASPYQYLGYLAGNAASTTLTGSWRTGLNTIIVQIKSGYSNEGFDARVQPSALCPTLAVSDTVAGRVNRADQFTVAVADGSGHSLTSATTTGRRTSVTSPPAYLPTGSTYTITDAMAAGSPDPLADYVPTISCTDTTTGRTVPPSGTAPTWTLTATNRHVYTCNITNTPANPSLSIATTASPSAVTHVGQLITYSFLVTNTGNVTLNDVLVHDTQTAPAGGLSSSPTCPAGTLAPGAWETCTATYTVTQADIDNGSVNDSATVSGVPPSGPPPVTSPQSTATVAVTQDGALTVVTSASPSPVTHVGQLITYSFDVTNTGNVTLTSVAVTGTQTTPAGPLTPGPTCPAGTLAPSAFETCTATYTVTQADIDNGTVNDSATASGDPPSGSPVTSPQSTATVAVTQSGALTVVASASPSAVTHVGQVITYSFLVTNTGNLTLTSVAVTGTQTAPAGPLTPGPTCTSATLAPSAFETCTATYTVTQADIDNGTVNDSATASGDPPSGSPVTSPQSTATVPVTQNGALTVVTSASPSAVTQPGQVITYSFLVTNTGNVTMTSVAVTGTQTTPAGPLTPGPTCTSATLAPSAFETCTATYTVTQADIDNGTVNDSATASGDPPSGSPVTSPQSTATVPVTQSGALTMVASASPSAVTHVGQVITYSFLVTNNSNLTLTSVAVTGTQTTPAGPLTSGPTCTSATLAAGAKETCTATYTVTQADIDNGSVNDSATVSGDPPSGSPVTSPSSTASVPVTRNGALTVVTSASPSAVTQAGQVITYSFLVTNTGNVTMTSVAVIDTQTVPAGPLTSGPACPSATLAAGAKETCTATYTVAQTDVDNGTVGDSATVSGDPPSGSPVTSPSSTLTVGAVAPTATATPTPTGTATPGTTSPSTAPAASVAPIVRKAVPVAG